MRPIRLEMSAFGPYSKIQVIDFEELQDRNLFLITGPTGSGKTTIFDAISFALYGETSGSMRTAEGLRSHFSDPDVLTYVKLRFELKDIVYEVIRTPKQMRPKAKSEGYTEQKPTAELIIEEGNPRTVITKISDVTRKIEEVIGINVEQFKQIMMIPQGEFKQLLVADSQEREKVLQKLFDTAIYKSVQFELDLQAKQLGSEIRGQKVERDTLATKIKCDDEHELKEIIVAEDKNIDLILTKTAELIKADKNYQKGLINDVLETNQKIEKQIKNKEIAISNNQKLKQLEEVTITYKDQLLRQEEMDIRLRQLNKGEKVLRLVSEEDNINQRIETLSKTFAEQEQTLRLLTQNKQEFEVIQKAYEEITSEQAEEQRTNLNIKLAKIKDYEHRVMNIDSLEKKVAHLKDVLNVNQIESHKRSEELIQTHEKVQQCKTNIETSQYAEVDLLKKLNEIETKKNYNSQLEELLEQLDRIAKATLKVNQGNVKYTEQMTLVEGVDLEYKKAKINFFMNQAAILAENLEINMPCPVCGSLEHPSPAQVTSEKITQEELEQQEKELAKATTELTNISTKLNVLKERFMNYEDEFYKKATQLSLELSEDIKSMDLEEKQSRMRMEQERTTYKLKELLMDKKQLEEIVSNHKKNQELLKRLETQQEKLEKTNKQLEIEITKISNELVVKENELQHVFNEVPESLRTLDALKKNINEVESERDKAIKKLKEISDQYTVISRENIRLSSKNEQLITTNESDKKLLESLKDKFNHKLLESGFISIEAYNEAKLSEETIGEMKTEQETYKVLLETLKKKIEELNIQTKDQTVVDLTDFDQQIEVLRVLRNELNIKVGKLTNRIEDNKQTMGAIKGINDKISTKEVRYKTIGRLSNVANGKNKARITFERYVLAAFLEDILKAANMRLKQMTQSRYTLSRTNEMERKNKQSGLELEIFDSYTGKSRHVKTLSGGESFKASLSMALGLSDVVQSYAGGVRLDTMFIDEGFGSLDQESLDSAINCLIDLQKTGRLVGIISHVQELKERIDTRLEISTGNSGSESRFVIG